jgi:hypothetical protein
MRENMKFMKLWHVLETLLCFIYHPIPLPPNVHMPLCDRFRLRLSWQHLYLFAWHCARIFFRERAMSIWSFSRFIPQLLGLRVLTHFYLYLYFSSLFCFQTWERVDVNSSKSEVFQLKNQFCIQLSEQIKSYRVQSILLMSICIQQIIFKLLDEWREKKK